MKRKVNFLTIIILLLSFIFLLLIRLNYPLKVSTSESVFHMIPIYYWILLIFIPSLISITFILTDSKKISVILAVTYFFILYSFYLFFIIPPAGTDISEGGHIFSLLRGASRLSVEQFDYFQWPIHYLFYSLFIKILGGNLTVLTLLLFSFILILPLFFTLYEKQDTNKKVFFLLPVGYIILSYYLINLQIVPQFTGLIFLILTIGCYSKYNMNPSKQFYILTIFFYIICVFTHPFIFVFFPAAIFLNRYVFSQKIFESPSEDKKNISLLLLISVYFTGFLYRFISMESHVKRIIYPSAARGEAWKVLAWLLGDHEAVGLRDYPTSPLYRLVSREIYLLSRYITFILLICFVSVLGYVLLKNFRKIQSFDISLGVASGGFFILGLIEPSILGQRAFQILFLKFPNYFSNIFNSKKKILVFVLVILIAIAPFLFTANRAINEGISGGRRIQDETTLTSGRWLGDHVNNESKVLVADLSFYPGRDDNISHTRHISEERINFTQIEIIVDNPKQRNRMEYLELEPEFNRTSRVYDNGNSQVLVKGNG